MIVQNMTNPTSGRDVPNQFIIEDRGTTYFQSYNSIIAKIESGGKVTLDEYYWDYSITTAKYRNQFLEESTAETRKKIEDGVYTLADLNC